MINFFIEFSTKNPKERCLKGNTSLNLDTKIMIAEVAELVDALDSKSSLAYTRCRFESGLRYNLFSSKFRVKLVFILTKFNTHHNFNSFSPNNYRESIKNIKPF